MKYREKLMKEASAELAKMRVFLRENRRAAVLLCIAVLLIISAEMISTAEKNQHYRKDSNGELVAVTEKKDEGVSLPLTVEAEKDGVRTRMDVILSFGREKKKEPMRREEKDSEAQLQAQIRELVRNLENQETTFIRLPRSLEDGTRLIWNSGNSTSVPAVLMLLPLGLMLLYHNQKEQKKQAASAEKNGILRQLPGFNSQLLLLISSGLIFHDAFIRIEEGYRCRKNPGCLGKIVSDIFREAEETGSSIPAVMERYSRRLGIREFSRLAGIVSDYQCRGVDLTEKLESESEILWTQRKKLAEERGRAAETKLSFPLALLLLVLVLITASPAVLQM